jgi:phage terminase small subunit
MLSEQHKKFADLFIATGNAKQSYMDAGYKAKGSVAEANASRLLRNAKVQEYIAERNKQLESPRIANMEEVKSFWTYTMRDQQAELKDRLKASEYIAKTNAAFIEKQEIKGELNINNLSPEERRARIDELIRKRGNGASTTP